MDVERTVVLPAPPEEVWETLTDPDLLEEWLGDEAAVERSGEEMDPPSRYTFRWDTGSGESEVEITLEGVPGGTRLTVTETRCQVSLAA